MNTSAFDVWFTAGVFHTALLECFRWDAHDILFRSIAWLELWLDSFFPLTLHDFFDTGSAQVVPFPTKPVFAQYLESFIDEHAATESATS
jgi:hypothetical protein